MQDLDVIQANNAKAEEEHATKLVDQGKFVLVKYTGLNYYGFESFDSEAPRNQAAIEWGRQSPTNRVRLLSPSTKG